MYLFAILSTTLLTIFLLLQTNFEAHFDLDEFNYGELKTKNETVIEAGGENETEMSLKNKIFFVGDVMLARHVEYLMLKNGDKYPFKNLPDFISENSYLVGNFEGTIPKIHNKTPNFNFKFSIDDKYALSLHEANFTHLSLANNHAFDFGFQAFKNTYEVLTNNNISPFGHPNILSTSSISFIEIKENKISIIGINTVFGEPNTSELNSVIHFAKENSDVQIYFIHWGYEYEREQSENQRKFAKKLSDLGADIIIGAHPHVVQGVEKINNTLVFYSLGNFIFDQYFNNDVKQGLVLELLFNDSDILVNILPVKSKYNAQPSLLTNNERKDFLVNLAKYSHKELSEQIESGQVYLQNILASSTEKVIIK